MTDPITFFYDRNARTGIDFELTGTRRDEQSYIYSVSTPDKPMPVDLGKCAARLREDQGGLITHVEFGAGGDAEVRIILVQAGTYEVPNKAVLLQSGESPILVDIDKERHLRPGDHLVIPVNAGSEATLHNLVSTLQSCEPDVEATIWSAIRRPTLDSRLSSLEDVLVPRPRWLPRWLGWIMPRRRLRGAPGRLLMLFNTLMLIAIALHLFNGTGLGDDELQGTGAADTQQPQEPPVAKPPNEELNDETSLDLVVDIHDLWRRLSNTESYDRLKEHFKNFPPDRSNLDLESVLKDPIAWGLIKLWMLSRDEQIDDKRFLDGVDYHTRTRQALSTLDYLAEDRHLLAYLACQIGGKPWLGEGTGRVSFLPDESTGCDALTHNKESVKAGLAALRTKLQEVADRLAPLQG